VNALRVVVGVAFDLERYDIVTVGGSCSARILTMHYSSLVASICGNPANNALVLPIWRIT